MAGDRQIALFGDEQSTKPGSRHPQPPPAVNPLLPRESAKNLKFSLFGKYSAHLTPEAPVFIDDLDRTNSEHVDKRRMT